MSIFPKKIILASQSPRRAELLRQAGFDFEVKVNSIDESFPKEMPVEEVAPFLARSKAHASKSFLQQNEIILAADSVVILGDTIFNKPMDFDDAVYILSQLSGQMHRVITGVCLLSMEKERVFSEVANVYFDELTQEEIRFYITEYQPFDKAGAYAIQEWIGLCKISKIEGTYSNIMGLPMQKVYQALQEFRG